MRAVARGGRSALYSPWRYWLRQLLLLTLLAVFISSPAFADQIGIYSDGTGASCVLAAGMNSSATLIHKFASGATGSRFRLDLSAAPGSVYYSFASTYSTAGTMTDDFSASYGQCLSGSVVIGTMVVYLTSGQVHVRPASGSSNIVYTNCSFTDIVASGGQASIGNNQCLAAGTSSATWGQIKSLYR